MSRLSEPPKSVETRGTLGRHSILLASLIFLMVASPILRGVPGGSVRFSILLSLVLTAAVFVSATRRWTLVVAVIVGGTAIAATAISEATGSSDARLISQVLGLGLLSMTTAMMLNTLVRAERVSADTIVGGICVYLMIGLFFAIAYLLATSLDPHALMKRGLPLVEAVGDASTRSGQILYFSFVTLTTLGFGDITPSGEWTQMLVMAEAAIGQLYVAIFIARLMGLYIAGDRDRRFENASSKPESDE